MYDGSAIAIPMIPKILLNAAAIKITTTGLILFVFPYILGEITYPSIFGKIKVITNVKINNGVEITLAVIWNNCCYTSKSSKK